MKKIKLLLIAFVLLLNVKVVFAQTTYKAYSSASNYAIEKDYSNSTLFLSKKTQFKVIKSAGNLTNQESSGNYKFYRTNINPGDELILLITNSAVNDKGELLDAVVKINNVKKFAAAGAGYATFGVKSSYTVAKDVANPTSVDSYIQKTNEPLLFELGTNKAQADISITYYLAGTYKDESNKGKLGNVTGASGTVWDFDNVSSGGTYNAERFAGSEGIVPLNGDAIIFYNKSHVHKNSGYAYEYKEESDGIAIATKQGGNIDSLNYENMAFIKTNIADSTFKLSFSGETCDLYLMFASPYPYDLNMPNKTIDVKESYVGEVFHYNIMQYVPNNYYGTIFAVQKAYENLYSNTRYTAFEINETFNTNLEVKDKDIKILNELGEDVTSYFNIALANNKLTITVKNETFNNSAFYGHAYNISVPLTIKNEITELTKITSDKTYVKATKKDANLIAKEETKTSGKVTYKVRYKITVNYLDFDTKESIKKSEVQIKDLNEKYITNYKDIDDTKWGLVELPKNYSGTVKGNVEVNYYFKKKYKVTVNFYEKDTNNKVAESQIFYYCVGDEYTTNYDIVEKSWELALAPANASGPVNGDVEVNYYFTPVVIENPPTGMITIPLALIALTAGVIVIYKKKTKKIYNV